MSTEPKEPTTPAVDQQRLALPLGIFSGVEEWNQIAKQRRVREYLETLPNAVIFRSGKPPKRKPSTAYIHSTCGCWQCAYCESVILARALRDVRADRWKNSVSQPQPQTIPPPQMSKRRLYLEVAPEVMERLERLKRLLEAPSYHEVIRQALRECERKHTRRPQTLPAE